MKQQVTISGLSDLKRFERQFGHFVDIISNADGSYTLTANRKGTLASMPMIIFQEDYDRVMQSRRSEPAVAGGGSAAQSFDDHYGAGARQRDRLAELNRGKRKVLNRREYLEYYFPEFSSRLE
jgi:hypothetical protein